MAICALNRNLTRTSSCGYSLPEIVDLYLINYEDLSATTVEAGSGTSEGCDEIATVTLKEGKKVYHVEPARNSASFEDTLVVAFGFACAARDASANRFGAYRHYFRFDAFIR